MSIPKGKKAANGTVARLVLPLVVGLIVAQSLAVPACPDPVEVSQPDGTRFELHLKGDEFFHWHEDGTGYAIVQNPQTGMWVYAKEADNTLKSTEYVVGQVDPRQTGLAKPDIARLRAAATQRIAGRAPKVEGNSVQLTPIIGTMKNLVVLVNWV